MLLSSDVFRKRPNLWLGSCEVNGNRGVERPSLSDGVVRRVRELLLGTHRSVVRFSDRVLVAKLCDFVVRIAGELREYFVGVFSDVGGS